MNKQFELIGKRVRVIKVVIFESGRKIKIEYIGKMIKETEDVLVVKEKDGTIVFIQKKFTKRVEEISDEI